MNNLQKKERLSALIAIKTTPSMKKKLEELSIEGGHRDFSDFIRMEWQKIIDKKKKE